MSDAPLYPDDWRNCALIENEQGELCFLNLDTIPHMEANQLRYADAIRQAERLERLANGADQLNNPVQARRLREGAALMRDKARQFVM